MNIEIKTRLESETPQNSQWIVLKSLIRL